MREYLCDSAENRLENERSRWSGPAVGSEANYINFAHKKDGSRPSRLKDSFEKSDYRFTSHRPASTICALSLRDPTWSDRVIANPLGSRFAEPAHRFPGEPKWTTVLYLFGAGMADSRLFATVLRCPAPMPTSGWRCRRRTRLPPVRCSTALTS